MKRFDNSALPLVVILAIAVAVCVLGVLQYRWTGEISASEQQRLTTVLKKDSRQFEQQFAYDFERLGESFEIDPIEPASTIDGQVLARYLDWKRSTTRPDFLAGVYLWRWEPSRVPSLESLNPSVPQFRASNWPDALEQLGPDLEKQFHQLPRSMAGHDAFYYPWKFYGDTDAFVRPLFRLKTPARNSDMEVEPIGFFIVAVDGRYLNAHYFPELTEDLAASGFRTAIRTARPPYKAIYLSATDFPISISSPDERLNLFDSVVREARRRGRPVVDFIDADQQWQFVAQHSSGSLQGAVALWQGRNLAISLTLLLILLSCMGVVISTARRAERLGRFQLQFVAGVSHELCTPLTVINSTVENVADGIIEDPTKVREYAAILRDQSGKLSRLLDQVLLLASGRLGESSSELQSVDVAAVVAQTIAGSENVLREKQFTVQSEISRELSSIFADPVLLSECVENLISNAIKYAGATRWISIRVGEISTHLQHEIRVTVEDRGIGIGPDDLASIFEPFYRVQAIRDRQTRGAGLGLYLVKRMVEAMGGRISASSELGRGSCFVLHLPVKRLPKEQMAPILSSASAPK